MKKSIYTPLAPTPSSNYSQAVKVGNRVYVSGQRPVNAETGEIPSDVKGQATQVLSNIRVILKEAGGDMDDIVRVNVYLADLHDFDDFNTVYSQFFAEPFPARTTLGVMLREILVEIDVIAEFD